MSVVKFTYHSPRSDLFIPDFAGDRNDKNSRKTEPYFLGGNRMAENYLKRCYQRTIQTIVAEEHERLFWVTRKQTGTHPQVVIGYLLPHTHETRTNPRRTTLIGTGHLYRFSDAIETTDVFGTTLDRIDFMHRFRITDEQEEHLLDHFANKENIVEECARELARLSASI